MSKVCPRCGSDNIIFTETEELQHYGKENCGDCGRWIKWVPYPESKRPRQSMLIEEGDDWRFNFGKHKDKLLSDVARDDMEYLDWMVNTAEFPEDVTEVVEMVLEEIDMS